MSTALLIALDPDTAQALSGSNVLAEIALSQVASPEDAVAALARDLSALDAVVIGPLVHEPVPLVQRVHRRDRDLAVLIFAAPDRVQEVCGRLAVTPFVGADTRCLAVGAGADQTIREAVELTRRRRAYREAMAGASARLAEAAVLRPRTPPVLDRLLDLAPVGVLSLDRSCRVVAGNRAASQILGLLQEELMGRHADPVLCGAIPGVWEALLGTAEETLGTAEALVERPGPDGRPQHLQLRVASAAVRANEPGYLVIVQDVTERVQADRERAALVQQLQAAVDARDEFLSIAAHELRTPLTSLKLLLQKAISTAQEELGGRAGELAHKTLGRADRQVRRLVALVNGLLDVSRLQQGQLELERSETDLGQVIREVVDHFTEELQRCGSPVQLELDAVVGLWDGPRLGQVVTNFLSNAIRYGAGRPIRIALSATGERAELRFEDQGLGIAADRLEKIFERFERGGLSENYGGLGLGLFIARQIVQAHGGTIQVESAPGEGSVFRVELPLRPV